MTIRRKLIVWASFLALLDALIPIPFFALGMIYILVRRPVDFMDLVRRVYAER